MVVIKKFLQLFGGDRDVSNMTNVNPQKYGDIAQW